MVHFYFLIVPFKNSQKQNKFVLCLPEHRKLLSNKSSCPQSLVFFSEQGGGGEREKERERYEREGNEFSLCCHVPRYFNS